ncbi:MAG: helix-turn-helix transcriptional regulator [Bacteroidota bacterium]
MKLNHVIKNLREEGGLTQEELARKAQLSKGYISRLEAGDYTEGPSIKTLQMIAEGLSLPLEDILNKAGITKEDYTKNPSLELGSGAFLRAKTDLTEEQVKKLRQFIIKLKNR